MLMRTQRHWAMHKDMETTPRHDTVLLEESIAGLELMPGDVVVDATLGGAGHFRLMLEAVGSKGTVIGIDADEDAIGRAQAVVAEFPEADRPTVHLLHGNFRDLPALLEEHTLIPTKILFDLGWSGFHLTRGRGFSFRTDEPLLMTYGDPETATTAKDLVNHLSQESLADLLWSLGEERFARAIAQAIVAAREESPIETSAQLVAAIEAGTPGWYRARRTHAATKTFQALRIAVNDELGALRDGLAAALTIIPDGGRIAVITFHSIEDRIVKTMFREAVAAGKGTLPHRKPIVPSAAEITRNPRARSAKLRVFAPQTPSPLATRPLTPFPAYA